MWRKIFAPHDANDGPALKQALASHWLQGGLFLVRLLGDYACGVVALEAYFSDDPWITAEYVAARVDTHISADTARRKLREMASAGKVVTRKEGRSVYFKLEPEVADAAIAYMKGDRIVLPADIRKTG